MNNYLIDWGNRLGISPFYRTHKISLSTICAKLQDIDYNFTLLARHYLNVDDVKVCDNLDLIKSKLRSALVGDLSSWDLYFEPLIFDEEVALECALIPFSFAEVKLLSLAGYGGYYFPKLDAYEVLTCGSISKESSYFKENERAYFRYIVGENVHQRIVRVLEKS